MHTPADQGLYECATPGCTMCIMYRRKIHCAVSMDIHNVGLTNVSIFGQWLVFDCEGSITSLFNHYGYAIGGPNQKIALTRPGESPVIYTRLEGLGHYIYRTLGYESDVYLQFCKVADRPTPFHF